MSQHHDPFAACHSARHPPYRLIHKALRKAMAEALLQLGNADVEDAPGLLSALNQVEDVLDLCDAHLKHENHFMHAALRQRNLAAVESFDAEHNHQVEASRSLRSRLAALRAEATRGALQALYLALSVNFAEQWAHMAEEETVLTEAFWSHFSDEEILAIEHALVSSIPAEQRAIVNQWILSACHHGERMMMLEVLRGAMPSGAFGGMLQQLESRLPAREYRRMSAALSGEPLQGAA